MGNQLNYGARIYDSQHEPGHLNLPKTPSSQSPKVNVSKPAGTIELSQPTSTATSSNKAAVIVNGGNANAVAASESAVSLAPILSKTERSRQLAYSVFKNAGRKPWNGREGPTLLSMSLLLRSHSIKRFLHSVGEIQRSSLK